MDRTKVEDRAGKAIVTGALMALVGLLAVLSQRSQVDPNGFVLTIGWALGGIGAMTLQAGLIGYVLSAS